MLESNQPLSARVTFSLDGKMLATIGTADGAMELWNAATCMPLRTLQMLAKGDESIDAIAFSPDSKTIASGHANAGVYYGK
ncbi:hypothetical protein V8C34DRAFT_295118 [Trichoderma compactum]